MEPEPIEPIESIERMRPMDVGFRLTKGRYKPARHLQIIEREYLRFVSRIRDAKRDGAPGPKLMVLAPPRHGKSRLLGEFCSGWTLFTEPDWKIMTIAYQDHFAATWGGKARAVFTALGKPFGLRVNSAQRGSAHWTILDHDGELNACGVRGGITGRGADVQILDDLLKNIVEMQSAVIRDLVWDLYDSAQTRLEPGGGQLISMHRWHPDDIMGRLKNTAAENDEEFDWQILQMPAICTGHRDDPTFIGNGDPLAFRDIGDPLWPERITLQMLKKFEQDRGPAIWQGLYQQEPIAPTMGGWDDRYFEDRWIHELPPMETLKPKIVALDPSRGRKTRPGDYSAIVFLGQDARGDWYCQADLDNVRRTPQITIDAFKWQMRANPDRFVVETNGFQEVFADAFKAREYEVSDLVGRAVRVPLIKIEHTSDKAERIAFRLDKHITSKRIWFVNDESTRLLVRQLKGEEGHDDGPDALEMAVQQMEILTGLGAKWSEGVYSERPEIERIEELLQDSKYKSTRAGPGVELKEDEAELLDFQKW